MKRNAISWCLGVSIFAVCSVLIVALLAEKSYPVTIRYPITSEEVTAKPAKDTERDNLLEDASDKIETTEQSTLADEVVTVYFPLELNTATYEELLLVPLIGDVTAQRIIQYRQQLGQYTNIQQLQNIKGIGKGTFEKISPYFYLSGDEWDEEQDSK